MTEKTRKAIRAHIEALAQLLDDTEQSSRSVGVEYVTCTVDGQPVRIPKALIFGNWDKEVIE